MSLCFIESKMPWFVRCSLTSKILKTKRMFILELIKCTRIKRWDSQPLHSPWEQWPCGHNLLVCKREARCWCLESWYTVWINEHVFFYASQVELLLFLINEHVLGGDGRIYVAGKCIGASPFNKMLPRCDDVIYKTTVTLSLGAAKFCLFNKNGWFEWWC